VLDGWLTGPDIGATSVLVLRLSSDDLSEHAVPLVAVYPAQPDISGVFYDPAGIALTFIVKHTDVSMTILIEANGEVVYTGGLTHAETYVIGENAEIGDTFFIRVISADGTASKMLFLEKIEEPEPARLRVEYVRHTNQWPQAGIWAWNARGDVFSGGWPGPQMEWAPRLDGEGYAWVFYLPEDTVVPVTLIFNNFGAGEQTVPYLTITQSTRVFQIGDGVEIGDAEVIE